MTSITITSDKGRRFAVTILKNGDAYGLDNCLTVDGGALVEFELLRDDGKAPYFISRYYLKTLIKPGRLGTGLCLEGSAPEYDVNADAMTIITLWLINESVNQSIEQH